MRHPFQRVQRLPRRHPRVQPPASSCNVSFSLLKALIFWMLNNSAGNHLPHGEEAGVTTQHVKSDSNKVTSLGWLASPYLNWPTSTVQALTSNVSIHSCKILHACQRTACCILGQQARWDSGGMELLTPKKSPKHSGPGDKELSIGDYNQEKT
jgi:hypothetical protein